MLNVNKKQQKKPKTIKTHAPGKYTTYQSVSFLLLRLEINNKLNMSVCFPETEISNTPEQGAFGMQLNFMLSGALFGFPLTFICWYGSIVNLSHITDATILDATILEWVSNSAKSLAKIERNSRDLGCYWSLEEKCLAWSVSPLRHCDP